MRRRAVGLFFICSAVVPLAIVSTAWACGALVSLKASPTTVVAGGSVTVSGANYSNAAGASAVTIRMDSRGGPIIGTATPVAGRISQSVQIPPGTTVGQHLLLSQQTINGVAKSGTPGRTTVRVTGAARTKSKSTTVAPVGAWGPPSNPAAPGGSAAVVSLDGAGSGAPGLFPMMLGLLASMGLLGIGLVTVRRSSRANRQPLGG